MEIKKSPEADLERKRSTWLLIGYVVAFAFVFIAFEWMTKRDDQFDESARAPEPIVEEKKAVEVQTPEVQEKTSPAVPKKSSLEAVEQDEKKVETVLEEIHEIEHTPKANIRQPQPRVDEEKPKEKEEEIFEIVESMPDFPGGQAALMQYLAQNIKYPVISQENDTQGRVIVQFVVNKDGGIVDAKVLRSVDPYIDKEALRVINSMPKWKPGLQRGKPVRVIYTVPVMFRLQ